MKLMLLFCLTLKAIKEDDKPMRIQLNMDRQSVRSVSPQILKWLVKVDEFLEEYEVVVRDGDRDTIKEFQRIYEPAIFSGRRKSKNGWHYMNCEWSDDDANVGPDTCICHYAERRIAEVDNIIGWYIRNLIKTK